MSRKEEIFIPALEGKNIPLISLDNRWHRLINGLTKTKRMQELENQLKELLKRQGKLNTETKALRQEKKRLMNDIVGGMENINAKKQDEYKKKLEDCNNKLAQYQDELLSLPKEINTVNYELMLETMQLCYEAIQENTEKIVEIADWIDNIRIELKKNIVRKQHYEMLNQNVYTYMHDIFGGEVINIFEMTYNPAEKMLKKGANESTETKKSKESGEPKKQ